MNTIKTDAMVKKENNSRFSVSYPYHRESRSVWYIYENDDIIQSFESAYEAMIYLRRMREMENRESEVLTKLGK